MIRITRGVSALSCAQFSQSAELIRFSATAWLIKRWAQKDARREVFFDHVSFDREYLPPPEGPDPRFPGTTCYCPSSESRLCDRGPGIHLNVQQSTEDGEGFQLELVWDSIADDCFGVRKVYAMSPEFEGFYLETHTPGCDLMSNYDAPNADTPILRRIFDGEAVQILYGMEREPATRVRCSCGDVAEAKYNERGSKGCARCGKERYHPYCAHGLANCTQHHDPQLEEVALFHCPKCGLQELCNFCIDALPADAS